MKGFSADCRHALRLYLASPAASIIAIVVLALGMALSGAFLSLYVDLVRPDPGFQDSRGITTIGQYLGDNILIGMPFEVVERLSDEMTSIQAAATITRTTTIVESASEPTTTGLVSAEFFTGLRPRLALGRGFSAEDHAGEGEPMAVLSYRYWQQQFDGDASVIGTVLAISWDPGSFYQSGSFLSGEPEQDSARFRIVGVMAEALPRVDWVEPGIWVPLERAWPLFVGTAATLQSYTGAGTLVRRAPGVSTAAVANELRARYDSPDAFPGRVPGTQLEAIDGIVSKISVQREPKRQLEMFLAGSLLLVIVAGANVCRGRPTSGSAPGSRRRL